MRTQHGIVLCCFFRLRIINRTASQRISFSIHENTSEEYNKNAIKSDGINLIKLQNLLLLIDLMNITLTSFFIFNQTEVFRKTRLYFNRQNSEYSRKVFLLRLFYFSNCIYGIFVLFLLIEWNVKV